MQGIKQLLAPFFQKRPNRLVPKVPFEVYQKEWMGVNSSILREGTPYEMLCKMQAILNLSPEMARLVELRGGDASMAMELLEESTPKTVPRNFVKLVKWPALNDKPKPTDAQKAILENVADKEVDAREFHSSALSKCLANGWVEYVVKEVQEESVTEDVKASRAEALTMGTVFHECVLEPDRFHSDRFHKEWQLSPTRSLVSKAALEALHEDPTRRLITPEIVDRARRISDAVWKHKEAARLLLEEGDSEISLEVWDVELQLMRKCRIDRLPRNRECGQIDLKKTRKGLSDGEIRSTIRTFGYHIQNSMYIDTLAMYEGKQRGPSYMIFATDEPPYLARVVEINLHEPDVSLICDGRGLYADRLARWALAWHEENWEAFENEGAYPLTNGRTIGA